MAADMFDVFATEINTLNNLLRKRTARALRSDSVGPAEIKVLQILNANGSRTVPEIGRLRLTSRQNIQIAVNRLKKAGFVEFTTNPSHKRSELVRLTSRGQEVFDHAVVSGRLHSLHGSEITETELANAVEFLRKVRRTLMQEAQAPSAGRRTISSTGTDAFDRAGTTPPGSLSGRTSEERSPASDEYNRGREAVTQHPSQSHDEEMPLSLL